MKKLRSRFHGLYWRQMFVVVGMVLLTLSLLGASFFALSYNYARNQKLEEVEGRARVLGQLSVGYLESGRYMDIEALQSDPDFRQLATFAATVSEVNFMICDTEGHVLLTTDRTLDGQTVTMPVEMTGEILAEGSTSRKDDLNGLFPQKRFVVGVPAVSPASGIAVGVVYAVSTS